MSVPSFGSVVLGGNVFGWTVLRDDAFALLDAFVERGGHAIDTADLYPSWAPGAKGGESEEILGAWMKARKNRHAITLVTKVAKWTEQPGLSPANIATALERSLGRLQTDHVDVYFAHQDDAKVDQIDYVRAFDALVKAGKVRTLGASNFTPARLVSARAIARTEGLATFEVSQDRYNLVDRAFEAEMRPTLEREGVVEIPYWSLASGFLTGKYRPGVKVDSARAEGMEEYLDAPGNVERLLTLDRLAAAHGVSVAAVALQWLRQQSTVAAPIASARTIAQLAPLFETVTLSDSDLASLDAHQSTQQRRSRE